MRSKVIFLLALIMGLISTLLFFNYTTQLKKDGNVQQETVQVIRTTTMIAENQLISAEMLEVAHVAKENIPPQAATDIAELVGKYSSATMEQGEIIVLHRVKSQQEEKLLLSRKIQEGYRAVSVGTPEPQSVQSVSNLIEPEDYVDIYFTRTTLIDGKEEMRSEQLFSNVRVLAVGRKMNPPVTEGEATYVEYKNITVELKPDDAAKLIGAISKGSIHFTLHPSIISSDEEE